ncbi:Os12g0512400, partial [Oryza sativa Japonica Group]
IKKVCHLDDIAPRVMEMLRLSYEDLTSEVQLCFQYCSIFPSHYKFRMEELTEMWVSSGLILQSTKGNSGQEKIAREHFNSGSGTLGDLTVMDCLLSWLP